jgi:hypothetical protein
MSVGVMEDYKLRDLRVSHTLGWSSQAAWGEAVFFLFVYYETMKRKLI